MGIRIILMAFALLILVKDHSRDKGAFLRAKIIHVICMAYFILLYANSIVQVPRMISTWDRFAQVNHITVGLLHPDLNLVSVTGSMIMGNILLLLAFSMLNRRDRPRRLLLIAVLLNIPLATLSYYRGYVFSGPSEHDLLILAVCMSFATLIHVGLYFIYRSRMMVELFSVPPVPGRSAIPANEKG